MPRSQPEHRALEIEAAAEAGDVGLYADPREAAYFHSVKTRGADSQFRDVEDAIWLYSRSNIRHALNALILGKLSWPEIADALDVHEAVVSVYAYLFFDVAVFLNAFDKHQYVDSLDCDEECKDSYRIAMQQDPRIIANRFRVGKAPPPNLLDIQEDLTADLHLRFKEHRGLELTNPKAMAALSLVPVLLRATEAVKVSRDNRDGSKESALRLALATKDETVSLEDAGLTIEEIKR